jgi:hypothetical protein
LIEADAGRTGGARPALDEIAIRFVGTPGEV